MSHWTRRYLTWLLPTKRSRSSSRSTNDSPFTQQIHRMNTLTLGIPPRTATRRTQTSGETDTLSGPECCVLPGIQQQRRQTRRLAHEQDGRQHQHLIKISHCCCCCCLSLSLSCALCPSPRAPGSGDSCTRLLVRNPNLDQGPRTDYYHGAPAATLVQLALQALSRAR